MRGGRLELWQGKDVAKVLFEEFVETLVGTEYLGNCLAYLVDAKGEGDGVLRKERIQVGVTLLEIWEEGGELFKKSY